MSKICPKCGLDIQPGKKFCTTCGARAEDDTPAAPRADAPAPEQPRYWEAETPVRSSASIDPPEFTILTKDGADRHAGNEEGDADEPMPDAPGTGLFERKPWLVQAICYGFLGAIALTIGIVIVRNIFHKNKGVSEKRVKTTHGNPLLVSSPDCAILLKKSLGVVRVQPRLGVNFFQIKQGQCVPPGSEVSTEKASRALLVARGGQTRIHVNSNTQFKVSQGAKGAAGTLEIALRGGEIYIDSGGSGGGLSLATKGRKAGAAAAGKYHLMQVAEGAAYYTVVAGGLQIAGGLPVAPGEQLLTTGGEMSKDAVKAIQLDRFMLWLGGWKDDFTPPDKKAVVAKAGAREKTDERRSLIEAAAKGFPDRIPSFASIEVLAAGQLWGLVVVKDSRENAPELPDYFAPRANLLKKINGHWVWLEDFGDYSEALYNEWHDKWGFDDAAEAELKLSY